MEPPDHNVSLLLGEMPIKCPFVFSKETRKLLDFCDMGNINDELNKFGKYFKGSPETELATRVLKLMARGLFKYFNYPIAYYASGFSSDQLHPVLWEFWRGVIPIFGHLYVMEHLLTKHFLGLIKCPRITMFLLIVSCTGP